MIVLNIAKQATRMDVFRQSRDVGRETGVSMPLI